MRWSFLRKNAKPPRRKGKKRRDVRELLGGVSSATQGIIPSPSSLCVLAA
jgi:hypothetical protein